MQGLPPLAGGINLSKQGFSHQLTSRRSRSRVQRLHSGIWNLEMRSQRITPLMKACRSTKSSALQTELSLQVSAQQSIPNHRGSGIVPWHLHTGLRLAT